jgi:tripartite-type tricarboxylate transporter receptor subunit TctC
VARLNRDVNDVLRQPEIRTALLNKGANVTPMTMERFAGFVEAETKRYATLIDAALCAACPW